MNKIVADILENISLDWPNDELGIERSQYLNSLETTKNLVLVFQGVRRSGKSTLMKQMIRKLNLGSKCVYVNFEDPRFAEMLDYKLLDSILEYQRNRNPSNERFFFFDEIQNVLNWEKWLHIQIEKKQHHFIISGSNSTLLEGKLGTALTGRHRTIEVFPFSYQEFKSYLPEKSLDDYLELGGFPLALSQDRPRELLREYFNDIIERDVKRHVGAKGSRILLQISKSVYESTGSETSFRKLANIFEISVDTVKHYVEALESAYLFFSCPYFTFSERQSVVRPRKYYPVDLGLFNAVVSKTGKNIGKKLETLVFLTLRKKFKEVYYWKEKGEVDFVVESEQGIQPIQVTLGEEKERHKTGLAEFALKIPNSAQPVLITRDNLERFLLNTDQFFI